MYIKKMDMKFISHKGSIDMTQKIYNSGIIANHRREVFPKIFSPLQYIHASRIIILNISYTTLWGETFPFFHHHLHEILNPRKKDWESQKFISSGMDQQVDFLIDIKKERDTYLKWTKVILELNFKTPWFTAHFQKKIPGYFQVPI